MAQEAQNGNGAAAETVETTKAAVIFTAVKPHLFVEAPKANEAIQFYKTAFGAEEVTRVNQPKRKAEQEIPLILSVELKLGSSSFLVSDLSADDSSAPVKSGSVFCLETVDVEAAVSKAVSAGAISHEGEIVEGEEGRCCGGRVKDPYGNFWMICSPAAAKKCELN